MYLYCCRLFFTKSIVDELQEIDNTEAYGRLLLRFFSTAAEDYVSSLPPPFGLVCSALAWRRLATASITVNRLVRVGSQRLGKTRWIRLIFILIYCTVPREWHGREKSLSPALTLLAQLLILVFL